MIETHYDAEAAVRLGRDVLAHEADAILAAAKRLATRRTLHWP